MHFEDIIFRDYVRKYIWLFPNQDFSTTNTQNFPFCKSHHICLMEQCSSSLNYAGGTVEAIGNNKNIIDISNVPNHNIPA